MLLRFSVSNFGSIRDRQELSLIASKLKGEARGLLESPQLRNETVLPSAVIYGPNASGKSNFIKALGRMRNLIVNSHRTGAPGEPIRLKTFALHPEYREKSTAFSSDFICNNALYTYEFEATAKGIVRELLQITRESRTSLLFERNFDEFNFGRSLKGKNKIIEALTRPNSLFLSAAAQNNHEEILPIVDFFRNIRVDTAIHVAPREISTQLATAGLPHRAVEFLKLVDVGISDFKIDEIPVDSDHIRRVILRNLNQSDLFSAAESIVDRETNRRFRLGHPSVAGESVYFDISDESSGTIQLLSILGPLFRALDEGHIIVADEFGSRMHTRASQLLISLFNEKESNPKGAQLVVATHDTNLLSTSGLRRDQVWFTEKDSSGATHLYPLTDFETRKNDNLEKGYLQGRFGAIPFASYLPNLLKSE